MEPKRREENRIIGPGCQSYGTLIKRRWKQECVLSRKGKLKGRDPAREL